MTDSLERRVCEIVADVLGLPSEKITLETTHETVPNWDSLNTLNLMMAIESEFQITVEPEEAAEIVSARAIVALLRKKGVA